MFNLIILTRIAVILAILTNIPMAVAGNVYRISQPASNIPVASYQNKTGMRELAKMEKNIFGRSFTNDTQSERVSRLERELFGMNQSGNINTRFDNLRTAYRGYNKMKYQHLCPNSRYYTNSPYPYTTPIIKSGGGIRGALNSLGNFMLGGTPTGFSPQITPSYDNWYNDDFFSGSSGYSRGFTSNRGYGYHNTGTGGGTGVTILD